MAHRWTDIQGAAWEADEGSAYLLKGSAGRTFDRDAQAKEIIRLADRQKRLEAHLRAFLDFYDVGDANPLEFFEIMHERADAIRKDLNP